MIYHQQLFVYIKNLYPCNSPGARILYDDFDVEDDGGFVVAAVSDMTNVLGAFAGGLMFFGGDGARQGDFRDSRVKHPSAVVVLQRDTPFGAKGDLLLTEKESHTVWRLRLDRRG